MRTIVIDVRMIGSSGIGTYVSNLVPRIIRARPEWRFYLLGRNDTMRNLGADTFSNTELIDFNSKIYSIDEQLQSTKKIPPGADLVWIPHYNIPVLYRGPLLVTVHDAAHLAVPQFFQGIHKRLYARTMFALVRKNADSVLCVSQFTKDELVRLTGLNKDRINVIHLGVDKGWFELRPDDSLRSCPYLLYVGNVKPHKNLGILLKAFQRLHNDIPHNLVIAGEIEGFITGDGEAVKTAANVSDRIVVTGRVEDDELKRLVVNAEALVLPSLYEGFGLPPLEAMACGCPALVSTAASLPEICGDAALYFNPYDASDLVDKIRMLVDNKTLKEALKDRGRRRARKFSWDKTAENTLNVIDDLIRRR